MKIIKAINCGPIHVMAILAAFAFAQPVFALCIDSDPPSDTILAIDANNGCVDIQGQDGCSIKDGVGTCTYMDSSGMGFTVHSTQNADGSVSWQLAAGFDYAIDTAVVGGGSRGKNNCGYIYDVDVTAGSGGDCKAKLDAGGNCTGAFQNITSLDVCTDRVNDVAPPKEPVAATLRYCQDINADGTTMSSVPGTLDETGIICPTEFAGGPQKNVIVCNLEKDKYAWGAVGAHQDGSQEEVCCKCGLGITNETACFVSDDPLKNEENNCDEELTSVPAEEVILQFQKDGTDPCQKIRSGGKVYKTCW